MDSLQIEATANTPAINFIPRSGLLEIKGRSISENSVSFYRPLLNSIDNYIFKPAPATSVHIYFDYCNTASAKCIIGVLKKLESLAQKGMKVEVSWYYKPTEPTMYQAGMDYKSILKLDFKMVKL